MAAEIIGSVLRLLFLILMLPFRAETLSTASLRTFSDAVHKTSPILIGKASTQHKPRNREKIKQMYVSAQNELKMGRSWRCIDILSEILKIDSRDSHSWLLLGRTYARIGQTAKAMKTFAEGNSICPKSVHIIQAWAVLEQKYGNVKRARALFEEGLSKDPGNAYICHAWGSMEDRLDNKDRAKYLFRVAFEKAYQSQICIALGELEASLGDMKAARKVFETGVERCKEKGFVFMAWAKAEEKVTGNLKAAETLLKSALEVDGDNVKVHIAHAQFESRRGNIFKTREILVRAASMAQKDAQLFNMWATIEQKAGHFEKALDIIKRAKEKFPAEQSLLQTEGTIEEKLGHFDRAIELFRGSTEIRPTAPAYVAWALLVDKMAGLQENKDDSKSGRTPLRSRDEARKLFELGMKADPKHGPLYNAYGSLEARLGNLDKARGILKRGIEARCSDRASVWHGLGSIELRQGDVSMARKVFSAALSEAKLTEDVSFLSHSLGALELGAQNPSKARKAFAEGLKRCPTNSPLLLGSALAEVKLGCIGKARGLFKKAVLADKFHAHAWQAWGVLETREGNCQAARELFEGGLRAVPTHSALWQAYGMLEVASGNEERARWLFSNGIERCRGHSSLIRLLQSWACFELRCNDLKLARKLVKEALEVEPCSGACWAVYASIEERAENYEKAEKLYEEGIRADPKHGPLYRNYGALEVKLKKYGKARELLEVGLEVAPYHAQLYHQLAELEAALGNIEGLSKLNLRAQALFRSGRGRECNRVDASRVLKNISSLQNYIDFVHGQSDDDADIVTDLYEAWDKRI